MRYALPVTIIVIVLLLLAGTVLFVLKNTPAESHPMQNDTYRVVNTYPHDRFAFTEGLAYHDGQFVESTGPRGNSTIRLVNLTTGSTITEHHLPNPLFAEGATVFGNRIAQETETLRIRVSL